MDAGKAPFIRVGLFIIVAAMLLYMPIREFLKITFMLGIPFVFILAFMKKKPRYSIFWIISLLLLAGITGGYLYMLKGLPEQIVTHQIVIDGTTLMSEGRYDEAIAEFTKLEQYNDINTMNKKVMAVEKEKESAVLLKEAKEMINKSNKDKALELLEKVPSGTGSHAEASSLIKSLKKK